MRIALTGATGFVGQAILTQLHNDGHTVHALARRDVDDPRATWFAGDLANPPSLDALVQGCDAVVHCAGAIKGQRAHLFATNVEGTGYLVLAAARAKIRRFVHISSLAARAPALSDYANSKFQSEALVRSANFAAVILRPGAVYGPGDRETLTFFTAAQRGVVPVPGLLRCASLIHVEDFARAVSACLATPALGDAAFDVHDGTPGGYPMERLVSMIGDAVGTQPRAQALPRWLVGSFARVIHLMARISGAKTMLSPGKVRELFDLDTVVRDDALTRRTGWTASIAAPQGLAATAQWYRAHGWL